MENFVNDSIDHYRMLVTIPEVFLTKSEQNIWNVEIWIAEELFDYLHPFLFQDFFSKKLPKDQFQVLFELIKVYSSSDIRKEFHIQHFLDNYPSPSKFGPGSKAKGAAKRDFARRQTSNKLTSGSLFAESFSPKPLYESRPMPQPGNFNIPKPPSVRCSAKLDDMGFTGYLKPGESKSMEELSQTLSQEYSNYQQDFNSPPLSERFDTTNYDQEKFLELGVDLNAKKTVFHKTTVDEARSALHAEMEGHIENPQRLDQSFTKSVDLDFKVDGPYPFTHVDIKHPVGSEILQKQNSPMDLETMAYKMGGKLVDQKNRFCNLEQGPKTSENVLHIVDLAYVPSHEKEIIKEYCLKGAEDADGSEGILFLNDNDA